MRWKLLLIVSLLATLVGAGGSLALVYVVRGALGNWHTPDAFLLGTLVWPLATLTYAGIFVYRHTARRRKLQMCAALLLAISLTLAVLAGGALYARRQQRARPPAAPAPSHLTRGRPATRSTRSPAVRA